MPTCIYWSKYYTLTLCYLALIFSRIAALKMSFPINSLIIVLPLALSKLRQNPLLLVAFIRVKTKLPDFKPDRSLADRL